MATNHWSNLPQLVRDGYKALRAADGLPSIKDKSVTWTHGGGRGGGPCWIDVSIAGRRHARFTLVVPGHPELPSWPYARVC